MNKIEITDEHRRACEGFRILGTVSWNRDSPPFPVPDDMIQRFGEGPFEVTNLRLHNKEARKLSPNGHPLAVTVLTKIGEHEMSGSRFTPVP